MSFALDQGDKRDLAGAVKAQGDAGRACPPAGIAGHVPVLPTAGGCKSGGLGVSEDGAALREADLSAVGVAAEIEIGLMAFCLLVCLRRMGEKDRERLIRNRPEGSFCIRCFVEMGVVNANYPDLFAAQVNGP